MKNGEKKEMYDFLIVGAGLCGCVIAEQLKKKNKKVLVIDKRNHVGGNVYTENIKGITKHVYGAHIFRTNRKDVWDYMNTFDEFNHFVNSPIAIYKDEIYNLPFNMNTFVRLYGVKTPNEALEAIKNDSVNYPNPKNLEEYALSVVGKKTYEKLIKGYTEKQWGKKCSELPKSIMGRIPIRLTFDNNYYNDKFQGVPIHGYTEIINKMLSGVEVRLGIDYNANRDIRKLAKKTIYTGGIDALFDYQYGKLEYRSLKFEDRMINVNNAQGVAVVNYTSSDCSQTRTIEHKHFLFGDDLPYTLVTYEYPTKWDVEQEPYYPIQTERNIRLYEKYKKDALSEGYVLCGRLGSYKYFDMQQTIINALDVVKELEA